MSTGTPRSFVGLRCGWDDSDSWDDEPAEEDVEEEPEEDDEEEG
jgi:hypothetical protein